jgi:hypothetical protein
MTGLSRPFEKCRHEITATDMSAVSSISLCTGIPSTQREAAYRTRSLDQEVGAGFDCAATNAPERWHADKAWCSFLKFPVNNQEI